MDPKPLAPLFSRLLAKSWRKRATISTDSNTRRTKAMKRPLLMRCWRRSAQERPRSRTRVEVAIGQVRTHRSIVAEAGRREQYEGLWSKSVRSLDS